MRGLQNAPATKSIPQPPRAHAQTHTPQISVQSNNPRRSYCDLNMSNLGVVCHRGFDRKFNNFAERVHTASTY